MGRFYAQTELVRFLERKQNRPQVFAELVV